jgi:hypothetical protein
LFGIVFGRLEVDLAGVVPVQDFDVIVLFEQVDEEGETEGEAVVVEEGFGGNFFVDLFFAPRHVLDVVDGEGWYDHVELFEVFVLFGGDFGAGLDHEVEVIDFVAELVLQGLQNIVELLAAELA